MSDLAALLSAMPDNERRKALASLPVADLAALEYAWTVWARSDQLPPPPPWLVWLILTGRGWGKTRTSAEAIRAEIEAGRRVSIGLVGPTADTLRRDQVAALLACSPPWNAPSYEASQRRVVWQSGAIAYCLSSEEPERIRGLNLDFAWIDELCAISNQADVWSNLQLALRVSGPKGHDPACIISTTPKRQALLKQIMQAPGTLITRASTFANAANLSKSTLDSLQAQYGGTTLGRQELLGELIDDVDGSLWTRAMLDECRVMELPHMRRVVVAIDPAGGSSRRSDETGIIGAGVGREGHGYVLADASGRYSPEGWARAAIGLYRSLRADTIVAEQNYGGEMVAATIRAVDGGVPVKMVHASRGKAVRAEPIVAFYEQRRVHHVGNLPGLEDQLCGWDPASNAASPDRLDAMVWALTELMTGRRPMKISDEFLRLASIPQPGSRGWRERYEY